MEQKKSGVQDDPACAANAKLVSAIDLGTYGCRMLIGTIKNGKRQLVSRFSQTVKLDVTPDGLLAESSKSRLIRSLLQCHSLLEKHNVQHYKCVGTAACRAIKNPDDFVNEIKQKTNIKLDIISPKEEIKLACLGAMPVFAKQKQSPMKFICDIGGGSTDLGLFLSEQRNSFPKCIACTSLPYGILKSSSSCNQTVKDAITKHTRDATLNILSHSSAEKDIQVISTSGPLASIVTLNEGLTGYHGPQIHGFSISYPDAISWIDKIEEMPPEKFSSYELSDTVVKGLPILRGVLDAVKTKMYISSTGVRHGLLRYLMAKRASVDQEKPQVPF